VVLIIWGAFQALNEPIHPPSTDGPGTDGMASSPLPSHPLAHLNLNLSELKKKPTSFRIQTREHPDEFKLIYYPTGEFGHRFDAEFLREKGFRRSHGIEISTETSKICSVIMEFENCSGVRESYEQMLNFLTKRFRYDCYPYTWVPRWNEVYDVLNHFIVAVQPMSATEVLDLGERATWLYDWLNDFFYIVSFSRNFLFMVGETGSLDSAIEYARVLEGKIQQGFCSTSEVSKLQLSYETSNSFYGSHSDDRNENILVVLKLHNKPFQFQNLKISP